MLVLKRQSKKSIWTDNNTEIIVFSDRTRISTKAPIINKQKNPSLHFKKLVSKLTFLR